jgi:hypothetical protein
LRLGLAESSRALDFRTKPRLGPGLNVTRWWFYVAITLRVMMCGFCCRLRCGLTGFSSGR